MKKNNNQMNRKEKDTIPISKGDFLLNYPITQKESNQENGKPILNAGIGPHSCNICS